MIDSVPFWIAVGALALFVFGFFAAARSHQRLLVVEVSRGRITGAKGRALPAVMSDFEDVLKKTSTSAVIILVVRGGQVAVETSGHVDENIAQRLRNVVGRFPAARLRTAPRVRRPA